MEKLKRISKNEGITLIALIITIVVMLILIAVITQVAIDSDLIDIAEFATNKTETAYKEEQDMNEFEVKEGKHGSLGEYMSNICSHTYENGVCTKCGANADLITFYINGDEFTAINGWDWEKWCGSEYDTYDLSVMGSGIGDFNVTLYFKAFPIAQRVQVDKDDIIVEGHDYTLTM